MNSLKKIRLFQTLKSRLIVLLLISCLIPILLIGIVSFRYTLQNNRSHINGLFESEAGKTANDLRSIIENMRYVSQQLVLEGFVRQNIVADFKDINDYQSVQVIEETQRKMAYYEVSNPHVANITYYDLDGGNLVKLNSSLIRPRTSLDDVVLARDDTFTYYGPHKTHSVASDYLALSLVRRVDLGESEEIYIYIESAYRALDDLFPSRLSNMDIDFIITSTLTGTTFGTDERLAREKVALPGRHGYVTIAGASYYAFKEKVDEGWSLMLVVPAHQYNREITSYLLSYLVVLGLAIVISVTMAVLIWRMVYLPFLRFSNNLRSISNSNIKEQVARMNLKELDDNIEVMNDMRAQILALIQHVEKEQQEKSELAIKQLFYKINPHFLYNTLDTLRWYAKSKAEEEIFTFVTALNKLLIYNMEKDRRSTLGSEIEAIDHYIHIQSMKYDIHYVKKVAVSQALLAMEIPRFILQPLVENAILHGLEGEGAIQFEVFCQGAHLVLKLSDDGYGIDPDVAKRIRQQRHDPEMKAEGIGLQYVFKMLNKTYGDAYGFDIRPLAEGGTTCMVTIPYKRGGEPSRLEKVAQDD